MMTDSQVKEYIREEIEIQRKFASTDGKRFSRLEVTEVTLGSFGKWK